MEEKEALESRSFDLAWFYARVQASPKERAPLRQDLVRGVKDYHQSTYGFDRYGAETILHLPRSLSSPHVFGFAAIRILRDRRIATETKLGVAELALDMAVYGAENGVPHGSAVILSFLAQQGKLSPTDLRYGLLLGQSASEPFAELGRGEMLAFFRWLVDYPDVPLEERLFWAHTLIARHNDRLGTSELINALIGYESAPLALRQEICLAWINHRQPRLTVVEPERVPGFRGSFVAEHLPFWVAHAPSWPTHKMVHYAVIWLARLENDPLAVAQQYLRYAGPYRESVHSAVADILSEHRDRIDEQAERSLIEEALALAGEANTRQRFYRLGLTLFGQEYVQRASTDAANRVRQWAAQHRRD